MTEGLLYIFTGTGKGKTSAALGMLLRATCAGMKVAWIAWYKEASWDVSEYRVKELLPTVDMFIGGKGFYFNEKTNAQQIGSVKVVKAQKIVVVDKTSEAEHQKAAQQSLELLHQLLEQQSYDLIICDELVQAVSQQLVNKQQTLDILQKRGKTHLVLTGRDCPQSLIDLADTVSSVEKIKHAYDQGIMAVKGLDF
ncbi:hypothetical protein C5B42_00220 [Candidatus Cerribacteria bacterium 'Amazon FNV 2010 28 9']|uniref:Cob(I)yrinic acid a,c-diamide adenosyltransferase n=1 Tax=Candidatus Cerribacteria bacterium 'Amazon FNV 2010 28 9' TaxID=2081795 RepID=A0A317JRR9_9BACT|nr:MAG: hypothetical protein C5B42_00220 [Candidatus Cerribacteria bacterium 'Amazon FNV 2010 28 9']